MSFILDILYFLDFYGIGYFCAKKLTKKTDTIPLDFSLSNKAFLFGLGGAFGYCGSGCRACDMCSAAGLWCSCGCGAGPARRCPGCCCRHRMFRCCLCCMNRGMCGYHADNRACTGSCCRCLLGCQRGSRICGYGGRSSCRCCNNNQLRCGCRCGSRCLRRYCGCLPCRDACCSACYSVTGGICGMRG